ncbi:class I SAM-dependent methyltransferase [Formosa sp. A9]|uniref:class I SAM-dependent methyltransferase n=1 Tax=Formosa sp. A9 TaxID=3442641 RepID=UPI003EBBA3CC
MIIPQKTTVLHCEDFSVSGEKFELKRATDFDILITTPQPKGEELGQYYKSEDYISHTDGKRNVFERVYHAVKSVALQNKLKLINSYASEEKSVLDVGCGTGDFLALAQKNGWSVRGVEPNDAARKLAQQKLKNNQSVLNANETETLKISSFDVVTLWHVLEHLPDLEEQITFYTSLLKPNGKLIIAVPNYKSYDANYYKAFWAAYDVPRHLWHFSKKGLSQLLEQQQLLVEKTLPMFFDAFYVSLLSEKYKTGKMNVFNAFRIGMLSNMKAKRSGEYSSLIYMVKKA